MSIYQTYKVFFKKVYASGNVNERLRNEKLTIPRISLFHLRLIGLYMKLVFFLSLLKNQRNGKLKKNGHSIKKSREQLKEKKCHIAPEYRLCLFWASLKKWKTSLKKKKIPCFFHLRPVNPYLKLFFFFLRFKKIIFFNGYEHFSGLMSFSKSLCFR